MNDKKLHTPGGFKDLLPEELVFKQTLAKNIEEVFRLSGYLPVESPMLEYVDVFEGKGSTSPKHMYRFIDRDGDTLTLRSDMTPPIARIAATCYAKEDAPMRFCYTAKAFRCQESYKGKAGEFTESGVELIGAGNALADAEVVALAIDSLLSVGLTDFRIDLGEVGYLLGILEESGLNLQEQADASELLAKRNFAALETFLSNKPNLNPSAREALTGLHSLIGGFEILEKARSLTQSPRALKALDSLKELKTVLDDYGTQDRILFDLGMTGHLNYYTGILFQGYARGIGFSVLDGGRYDKLLEMFGISLPAVGFALKIDNLASALSGASLQTKEKPTLLAFSPSGRKAALAVARSLRKQGVVLETSLEQDKTLEWHVDNAAKRGNPGILYFDGGKAILWDMKENIGRDYESDILKEFMPSDVTPSK
ncbi:MAG: ATP phosphoribosyltransferase regulatory subunit [Clostridiales bacterium]|jgi:ATP phosphoribosyltransferase regulatory subunit|nr:ATP phosphoribosyltransferase regulatory subunit [Clostridiales bacterium]